MPWRRRSPSSTWLHQARGRRHVEHAPHVDPRTCAHAPDQRVHRGVDTDRPPLGVRVGILCHRCGAVLTKEGPMVKVKLVTSDGHYVATVDVLPMTPMPDVLLWGSRYFRRVTGELYREVFCYVVPPAPMG